MFIYSIKVNLFPGREFTPCRANPQERCASWISVICPPSTPPGTKANTVRPFTADARKLRCAPESIGLLGQALGSSRVDKPSEHRSGSARETQRYSLGCLHGLCRSQHRSHGGRRPILRTGVPSAEDRIRSRRAAEAGHASPPPSAARPRRLGDPRATGSHRAAVSLASGGDDLRGGQTLLSCTRPSDVRPCTSTDSDRRERQPRSPPGNARCSAPPGGSTFGARHDGGCVRRLVPWRRARER